MKKRGAYLFTRVNLKPEPRSTHSVMVSKAGLFAQRNFLDHLFGQVDWESDFSSVEKQLLQSLYNQVASVSGVLNGLVRVHEFVEGDYKSFIYAVDFPKRKIKRVARREAIDKIQSAASYADAPLDFLTYFELALRKPKVLNPKLAVKRLSKTYGRNFIFCLLGMDLAQPVDFSEIPESAIAKLQRLDRTQLAILLNERPYNTALALSLASNLIDTGHAKLAQMALQSGCRLDKTGETYGQISSLAKKIDAQPSGSYRFVAEPSHLERLFGERLNAQLNLSPLSGAVLNSLGDLPLTSVKVQLFIPTTENLQLPAEEFSARFDDLQQIQTKGINSELMEATADLLAANGFPQMAFCFRHQALYLSPGNKQLRNKIEAQSAEIEFAQYSKLLSQ